jgi:hypothetical protein
MRMTILESLDPQAGLYKAVYQNNLKELRAIHESVSVLCVRVVPCHW